MPSDNSIRFNVYVIPIHVPFLCLPMVCKNTKISKKMFFLFYLNKKKEFNKPVCSSESILISDFIVDFATGVDVVLNDDIPVFVNRLSIGNKFVCNFSLRFLFSIELNTRDD